MNKFMMLIIALVGSLTMTACASETAKNIEPDKNSTVSTKTIEAEKTPEKSLAKQNNDALQDEKSAKKDLTGKYVHQGRQGETSYEFVVELKAKNAVSYKSEYTGGTDEKTGVWNFDEKKNLLTVKFDEDFVIVFKIVGKNLEVVEKADDNDPIYGKGAIFKKV